MRYHLKSIQQQVIVITGASSGIGLATARLAAARGATVVVAARSPQALRQLSREIRLAGGDALAIPVDVSSEREVERLAESTVRAYGRIDTWINDAAVSAFGTCLEVSTTDMRRIMDTNFWGVVHGSREACRRMHRNGGALINIGSVLSDRAVPLQGMYSASKHAIKGWTDALRVELLAERIPISVTLIKPAAIDTPYAEHARNYLADQPTHPAPVYSAESVARAILHAAEHPTRELTVGSAGLALTVAGSVFPALTDRVMARWLIPAMHRGTPRDGRPALFAPTEDLRVRGDYRGYVRDSVYTAAVRRPVAASLIAGSVTAAVLLAGDLIRRLSRQRRAATGDHRSRSGGNDRPNTRRMAVRAHQ